MMISNLSAPTARPDKPLLSDALAVRYTMDEMIPGGRRIGEATV